MNEKSPIAEALHVTAAQWEHKPLKQRSLNAQQLGVQTVELLRKLEL